MHQGRDRFANTPSLFLGQKSPLAPQPLHPARAWRQSGKPETLQTHQFTRKLFHVLGSLGFSVYNSKERPNPNNCTFKGLIDGENIIYKTFN